MMEEPWCTIESDPGVFTELIESIGVRGVQMEEIYSLDEPSFSRMQPVYGLVFLFKWTGEKDDRRTAPASEQPGLFFAHQVIPNACATQAILSVLLNCAEEVDIGETLSAFKSFTGEFPPDMKGLAISNSETIRSVHNGFSRHEPFFDDGEDDGGSKEDAFHFVAYVPHDGKVFELDGLKPGPIMLGEIPASGECDGANGREAGAGAWLKVASPAIENRIARYTAGEIRFNLMAIVKNRRQVATEGKELCMRHIEAIDQELAAGGSGGRAVAGEDFLLAQGVEGLETQKLAELRAAEELSLTIANEQAKVTQWRKENMRRKHNHVPFAATLLKTLAEKGKLEGLVEFAAAKTKERQAARLVAKSKILGDS